MTGFGKTTQAISFAQSRYKEGERFSASEQNLREWLNQHKKLRNKTLLILDDLQWLFTPASRQELFELLVQSRQVRGLHILLVSRVAVPPYLSPLWVTRQIAVEDQEALRLDKPQIKELLSSLPVLAALQSEAQYKLIKDCLNITSGYALAINAYLQRYAQTPNEPETVMALATQDVFDFFDQHLLGQWTASRISAAILLSVYPRFTTDMARQLLGEQTDTILQDFLEVGSFLRFTAPDTYTFAPFFWNYLAQKLQQRPNQELIPLYESAARHYEQQRDLEQALRCYKLAGHTEKIVELVVYLCENADGCAFARIAQPYLDELPSDLEHRDPRILGAKAMSCAYRMKTNECTSYINRLRELANDEQKFVLQGDALATYIRTLIACPFDTAESILQNMVEKANQQQYFELLPNIEASLALCALLKNDATAYNRWLTTSAPDEHADFYITARFQLLVKAKVYTALGRELEALYILELLEKYAILYHRTYLHIELLTLKAVIMHHRNEDWQETLLQAISMAQPYGLIRIFADQGAALWPLLQKAD